MEARYEARVKELIARGPEAETELYDYIAMTAPFLAQYEQTIDSDGPLTKTQVAGITVSARKGVQRQDIYNQYLQEVEGASIFVPKKQHLTEACRTCGAKFTKFHDEVASEEVCKGCGAAEYILSEEVGFKEEQEMHKNIIYSYKRENHFNEWVSQFQAKESTSVPPELIQQLREEFKKLRIKDLSDVTHDKVRAILKKIDKASYYEHAPYITTLLNGIQPPTMPQVLEDRLRLMFYQIQKPFEKHRPAKRKNFLSYSFTLYKMCELLGEDQYLPCFPLLKSKEKLYEQDKMWKGICHELKWEYIHTV